MNALRTKIPLILALLALILCIARYRASGTGDHFQIMRSLVPSASEFVSLPGNVFQAAASLGNARESLGYLATEQAIGYAGPVSVMVFVNNEGRLKDLRIVDNEETPAFFTRVIAAGYLDQFRNKDANSPFALDSDLDAISRATFTSGGIAEAARKASHKIAESRFNMELPNARKISFSHANVAILGLLLLVPLLSRFKLNKLRFLTMLAGFALIGVWQKSPVSMSNIAAALGGNIPSLAETPFWLLLLAGVLAYALVFGRNYYCYWMCPMGAVAEGCAKVGKIGKLSYTPSPKKVKRYRNMRIILAWLALTLGFAVLTPSLASYEIFAPLFALQGNKAQWIMLPFFLFAGVFITRFWCRYFCPVGGILDALAAFRREVAAWIKKKSAK